MRQPLQKRSLFTRLWQQRPSALVTAFACLFVAYGAGGAWLVRQPMKFAGEPQVAQALPPVEKIETAKPVVLSEGEAPPAPAAHDTADIETAATDAAPEVPSKKVVKIDKYVTVITNSRPSLIKAPIAAITENSSAGPLPRIADNGKKPWELYGKPVSMSAIHSDAPKIVIILGGMGLNEKSTRRAITDLPADVTFAFAPYGNNLQAQVDKARDDGHEVLLQLPLEPVGYPATNPGPKTLLADADINTNQEALAWHMSRFAGYAGIVNYMGGRFLASPTAVKTLLLEVKKRGLAYLEDGSVALSATDQVAGSINLPVRHGAVVIDQNPDAASITAALQGLEDQARKGEIAIGSGSGLDVTIDTVRDWVNEAQSRGVVIVPATAAFKGRMG
ncbi:MAG: divergent polysaccharide deacetylase family protein [Alphaproteobacteria bacterium]|nr:divergent polysaccharide deacetylase family protein [Alphaproteobacteria bacterium]